MAVHLSELFCFNPETGCAIGNMNLSQLEVLICFDFLPIHCGFIRDFSVQVRLSLWCVLVYLTFVWLSVSKCIVQVIVKIAVVH